MYAPLCSWYNWGGGLQLEDLQRLEAAAPGTFTLATEACLIKRGIQALGHDGHGELMGAGTPPGNDSVAYTYAAGELYALDLLGDLRFGASGWVDWNAVLDYHGGPNHVNRSDIGAPILVDAASDSYYVQAQRPPNPAIELLGPIHPKGTAGSDRSGRQAATHTHLHDGGCPFSLVPTVRSSRYLAHVRTVAVLLRRPHLTICATRHDPGRVRGRGFRALPTGARRGQGLHQAANEGRPPAVWHGRSGGRLLRHCRRGVWSCRRHEPECRRCGQGLRALADRYWRRLRALAGTQCAYVHLQALSEGRPRRPRECAVAQPMVMRNKWVWHGITMYLLHLQCTQCAVADYCSGRRGGLLHALASAERKCPGAVGVSHLGEVSEVYVT